MEDLNNDLNKDQTTSNEEFQDCNDQEINQEAHNQKDDKVLQKEYSLEQALLQKDKGNVFFKENDFELALECYEKAEDFCPPEEHKQLSIIYSNIAICYMKINDSESVIHYTTKSIELNKEYVKPLQNRAQIFYDQEKLEESYEDYQLALKLDQNNIFFQKRVAELKPKVDKINEKRKEEVLTGLKSLGNTILGKFGMSLDNFKLQQNDNGSYNVQFQQ